MISMTLDTRKPLNHVRVLVAEDNEDIRMMFARFLEKAGYDVTTVADGEDAMLNIEMNTPNLVVLDLNMPFASGLDVLTYIRMQRALSDVKVMIVSGNREMLNSTEVCAADLCLLKPVSMPELVHKAQMLLNQ